MKLFQSLIAVALLSTTLIAPTFAAEPAGAQPAPEWLVGKYEGHNRNFSSTISKQDRAAVESAVADAKLKATSDDIDEALKTIEATTIKLKITADGEVTAKVGSTSAKGQYIGNNQVSWQSGPVSNIVHTEKGMNFSQVGNTANVAEYTKVK